MATNIDKALYAAPVGLDDVAERDTIEIEVENPDSTNDNGSITNGNNI